METTSQPGGFALLGRLTWMVFGPMLALFVTGAIALREGWFSTWDAVFGVVVALMIGGRWVEQRSGSARTATGEPATAEHFRRYVRVLLPLAAGLWGAANAVGNYVLV